MDAVRRSVVASTGDGSRIRIRNLTIAALTLRNLTIAALTFRNLTIAALIRDRTDIGNQYRN